MPTTRAQGLDLSEAQGKAVDFHAIRAAGYDWVTCKATEGGTYTDPAWDRSATESKAAGLLLDAYHFQTQGSAIAVQIAHFVSVVQGRIDLAPSLDFEAPTPDKWPTAAAARKAFAADLCKRALEGAQLLEAAFGRVLIYSYPDFLKQLFATVGALPELVALARRSLWLAWYPHEKRVLDDSEWAPIIQPWGSPEFCQWSGNNGLAAPGVGSVVDHDLFKGTRAELLATLIPTSESFTGAGSTQSSPPILLA